MSVAKKQHLLCCFSLSVSYWLINTDTGKQAVNVTYAWFLLNQQREFAYIRSETGMFERSEFFGFVRI